MEVEPFENPWIKKIRLLTHILLVSITFNIGLATALITHHFRSKPDLSTPTPITKPHKVSASNAEVIKSFFTLSFSELVDQLNRKDLLQDGYTYRDLALGCLTSFYHFDIKRAVIGKELKTRQLSFIHNDGGEEFDLAVFPGLDDTDFQLIHNFIKREKWPLTTEGLFEELKKESSAHTLNTALAQAFVSTSDFYTLYTLFRRKSDNVKASEVLQMLLEGPWKFFEEFILEQKTTPDLTEESMRNLLKRYVRFGIPTAGLLWIKLDSEYVLRNLDDQLLKEVVEPINQAEPYVTIFLKQLLCSARSDDLRKLSGLKLYTFNSLPVPEPYDQEEALKTFLPAMYLKETPVEAPPKAQEPDPELIHTVEDGDSLWKIAKKYQVSIAEIRKVNYLKTDKLKPGQKIKIPKGE